MLYGTFFGSKGFGSPALSASPSPPANITNTLFSVFLVVYQLLSTTVSRISRCFIFYTYLVVPSVARGFYIYLLIVIQILFFISQSSEPQQVSNLLIGLSIPYKIFLSDYSKQSRIHSQLRLTYLIFHPTNYYLLLKFNLPLLNSQGWFYTHDCTLRLTFEVCIAPLTSATCCVENVLILLPVIFFT